MELKVTLRGKEKIINKLLKTRESIDEKIFNIVKDTTLKVEATAKDSMRRGGIIKVGGKRVRTHSKPYEPPYVQTGALRANITSEIPTLRKGQEIKGKVGVRDIIPYGFALEFGYPPRNLIERPFLRLALAKNITEFYNKLREVIKL